MIQCKRVYDPASEDDGYRVLVDRLWPRGIKKADLHYDQWEKDLAPSNALRKEFHSDAIDFAEFSKLYREELEEKLEAVQKLVAHFEHSHLTLLYAAKNTEQNHALVLAEFLRHTLHHLA